MAEYVRQKQGFRFRFGGLKTNSSADSMPPDKYSLALNVRAITDTTIRTRAGQSLRFATGGLAATDMRAFSSLATDNRPRILVRSSADGIYLDTGTIVGSLVSSPTTPGATMIPFRPNQSPSPYMYVANGQDYQKFSAPSSGNVVVQQKVGIAEPQIPPDACPLPLGSTYFMPLAAKFTNASVAGVASDQSRSSDTISHVLFDSVSTTRASIVNTSTISYQVGEVVLITTGGVARPYPIEDVLPSVTPTAGVTIQSIFYYSGTSGQCVVVPGRMPANKSVPSVSKGSPTAASAFTEDYMASLRRGSVLQLAAEIVVVQSVTRGPDGTVAFETSTGLTHVAGEALRGLPAIVVSNIGATLQAVVAGTSTITSALVQSSMSGAGVGTLTYSSAAVGAAFASVFSRNSPSAPQADDYFHISLNIDNIINLNEIKILVDVGDGSFTQNYYYYTVRPSDLAQALANTQTQLAASQVVVQRALIDAALGIGDPNAVHSVITNAGQQTSAGASQWTEIQFALREFTRVGNDQTLSLVNANAVQIAVNVSAGMTFQFGSMYLLGGSQPDVGDAGAPYFYRVRPRSAITGVRGNPSPATRYGVFPRRQPVLVTLPSAAYDPQIDTWDIERYGGTVTSWRYVGSTPSVNTSFTDIYYDDAVGAGESLDFDNFEPWPSIDVPLNAVALSVTGHTALVQIPDPVAQVNVRSYLPGNLVQLGGANVYTLWTRPVATGIAPGNIFLFQFAENAGAALGVKASIYEPSIARQFAPYMWGPDTAGTLFAVGDALRPGQLYFSKSNAPDSAPDSYNIEITPPSEPLLGGDIVDGLSVVGSTERWWALYPQPDNPAQRYSFVPLPITRGLAAPYGHCTNGKELFFWAKDGIYSTQSGSLTDADLYNLFPHEGVVGTAIIRLGTTIPPPDYSRAGTFRLAHANGYLYATYQDSFANYRQLVLNTRTGAWCVDQYTPAVTTFYHPEQQAGTLRTAANALYDELLMGTVDGRVAAQRDLVNDLDAPISCALATFEYDGEDIRAGEQWGDLYIDALSSARASALTVQPVSLGVQVLSPVILPLAATRVQQPVSLGGGFLADFLGMLVTWGDDFTLQPTHTVLYAWQPSYIPKPETIADRFTDWDDGGIDGAKWVQGFILRADTFNQVKGIVVRDSDLDILHPFTPVVQHELEEEIAYSFNQPFIAHQMRLEPTDQLPWRMFDLRWVTQPTPETAEVWQTQVSTLGGKGYQHVRQISLTYMTPDAVNPLTFLAIPYDGQPPAPVVFPPTNGAVQKITAPFSANKGQLYTFKASCAAPSQVYVDQSEVLVGEWGRSDSYRNVPLVGGSGGDKAEV